MQVIVDNLLTNYQLQGKGKLVLFLHGWGDNLQGSLELQKRLAKSYQVLAPDLPGFGKSQLPPKAWDLDDYAHFLEHFLHKLNVGQPYALIGHSNGGAIAIRASALEVLRPQRIVLLAAAGIRAGKTLQRYLLQAVAKTGKAATIGLPERHRKALRRKLYTSAGSDMLVVEQMQPTFKKTVRQDVQVDAAKLKQPTLLLFAVNDQAVPLESGKKYAQLIEQSSLVTIDDAGHFLHLDKPEQVASLVEDFLK